MNILTPLRRINRSNIYIKLEGHNPSGTIKDRSITNIINNISNTDLKNKPVTLVTSGSAGLALYHNYMENNSLNSVNVIIPLKYSNNKHPLKLINKDNVNIGYTLSDIDNNNFKVLLINDVFINIVNKTREIVNKKNWTLIDQHQDIKAVEAHKYTAYEILKQLPDVTDVVCSTGTGATAAGLVKYLPSNVRVHARPGVSGEIDGLSDVRKYDNFCNPLSIVDYNKSTYSIKDALKYKNNINNSGYFTVGSSTGAALWLANEINNKYKKMKIVVISPDGKLKSC